MKLKFFSCLVQPLTARFPKEFHFNFGHIIKLFRSYSRKWAQLSINLPIRFCFKSVEIRT